MNLWIAIKMTLVFTVLTGIVYPVVMVMVCNTILPSQSQGSLVTHGDVVVGSSLIGQNFTKPGYFQPRPSAAGDKGYDATSSSGSNLGPTSQKLADALRERASDYRSENSLSSDTP